MRIGIRLEDQEPGLVKDCSELGSTPGAARRIGPRAEWRKMAKECLAPEECRELL